MILFDVSYGENLVLLFKLMRVMDLSYRAIWYNFVLSRENELISGVEKMRKSYLTYEDILYN